MEALKKKTIGHTLIELLVAISMMGLVSVLAWRVWLESFRQGVFRVIESDGLRSSWIDDHSAWRFHGNSEFQQPAGDSTLFPGSPKK